MPERAAARWRVWLSALVALAVVTLSLVTVREQLDKAHVALVLLLVVLVGSAAGGRILGVTLATLGFLAFNLWFLPPYNTLVVDDPLDWLVLVSFLVTGLVAAQLLARAQREADLANARAEEVQRLAEAARHADALQEADRMKDALLASVSHDLRTPLTTIRGLAHAIADGGDERAHAIESEAIRLDRLVSDLLDLSRLDAGAMPLDLGLNTADDAMGAAMQAVGADLVGRNVRAAIDPAEPLLVGTFDLALTVRILANLLENALKYAPPASPVDFTVRREGEALEFAVADRGTGIQAADVERIYRPFQRGATVGADTRGTGLGLAIARRLAEAQSGSLSHRPRDGGGTVFLLRLPAADLTGADSMDAPPNPPSL